MRVDSGWFTGAWFQLTVVSDGCWRCQRVLGGVLVADLQPVGPDRTGLHADLAVAGVGTQEGEVHAGGVRLRRALPHGLGPVLVVAQAEEAVMVHEELGTRRAGRHRSSRSGRARGSRDGRATAARFRRSPPRPMPTSGDRAGRTTRRGPGWRSSTLPSWCARSRGCSRPRGCRPARSSRCSGSRRPPCDESSRTVSGTNCCSPLFPTSLMR